MEFEKLSRRDFLKLSASGALGFVLAEMGFDRALAAPPASQGRIIWSGVPLNDAPSFSAKEIKLFGIDVVVDLNGEALGDIGYGNPFNSTWYQIEDGYAYSGWIQPVESNYQKPVYEIHAEGQVGEICVPVCETKLIPYTNAKKGYRLYYGSVHWVKNVVVTREEKSVWYEIFDNELKKSFYVASHNMRLIPDSELTQLSPEVPAADKLLHVDLTMQLVTAFEGNTMVFSARCSSGGKGTYTPTGEFSTYHKGPSVHMTNQDEEGATNYYHLPGVPWCSFFTGVGNAFHGTYWHNDYGRPRSHGCVNLRSEDAKWVYRWTNPVVPLGEDYLHLPGEGTRVQIV
ncbi:MAG: L,D-transpeptidase [Anaerolineales bacterium]|nr:L,D-transpeptidase [Anaerolineales bacterium]